MLLRGLFFLLEVQEFPNQWLSITAIPIHKEGSRKDREKYGPISPMIQICKMFLAISPKYIQ
jgi:hypothetical protein